MFSVDIGIKENSYKVINRWYYTPLRLPVMLPGSSDVCWRCRVKTGTYIHVWWNCRVLGRQVYGFIEGSLGIKGAILR